MNGNEYQKKAGEYATDGGDTLVYALFGLIEEVGEMCGKVIFADDLMNETMIKAARDGEIAGELAKYVRANWKLFDERVKMKLTSVKTTEGFAKELGDVAWMLAAIARKTGHKMDTVLEDNLKKLADRKKRGVIVGKGDNR